MGFLKSVIVFVFFGLIQGALAKTTYDMPRVEVRPTIDGVINDTEWKQAKKIELKFETYPGDNLDSKVSTTAYMMEDGENIYFAFKAYDPEVDKIKGFLRDHDQIFSDDFVGVILDTFNDERRGFEFFVNPKGAQGDLTRDDSLNNEDSSWNAIWQSAGKIVQDGYVVEMAIPFSVLRFPQLESEQTWGIQFLRIYPRESRFVFSDHTSDRERDCTLCQVNKVRGMKSITAGSGLEVTPTLTYINQQQRDLSENGAWHSENDYESGADFRWAMTQDWILNATINPDFSQVESDSAQLDINTTFSLFYEEARQFFLDGADYFNSPTNLIHTRNIGDPDYGIKVTGKSNGVSFGALAAHDQNTSFLLPGHSGSDIAILDGESDVMTARVQRDIGEKSNIGVLMTHRSQQDYKNQVMAIDGRIYLSENDRFDFQWMDSRSDNPQSLIEEFDLSAQQAGSAYIAAFRHSEKDFTIRASRTSFARDFRADLGFISQTDFKKDVIGGAYNWYGDEGSAWTRWGVFGDWDETKTQDGKKLEEEFELHGSISGPMQFETNFGGGKRKRLHNDVYYDESFLMAWFQVKPTTRFTFNHFFRVGDQIDFNNSRLGKTKIIEPNVDYQWNEHLSLRINHLYQELDVDGGRLFTANVTDFRANYQFDLKSRLKLTLQRIDIDRNTALYIDDVERSTKRLSTQLIYSYKINPQSLFYLGYADKAINKDSGTDMMTFEKTVFAKLSYSFAI